MSIDKLPGDQPAHFSDALASLRATLKRHEDLDGRQLLLKRAGGSWSVGYSGPGTGTIEEISGLAEDEVLDRIRSIRKD